MVALPKPEKTTASEIFRAVAENAERKPRAHLGASQIGHPCLRRLWYVFRHALEEELEGRILRLFRRGEREEAELVRELMLAGVEVYAVDPSTGRQFQVSACGGHFGGSMDGTGRGFPEEGGDKWHLLEFKTHNDKSFRELQRQGVEKSKPEHYAQMQVYMLLSGDTDKARLTRAMYIAVNKNTDEIYTERVKYHGPTARKYLERAETVIGAAEPLERVSTDPSWYVCKFCHFSSICHGDALPEPNCRTCCHSTPEPDGTWSCTYHGTKDLGLAQQRTGCPHHVYIPALVTFAEQGDGNQEKNWIEYRLPDGRTFRNGTHGPGCYESRELRSLDRSLIGNPDIEALRGTFGARVEPSRKALSDDVPFDDPIPF